VYLFFYGFALFDILKMRCWFGTICFARYE